MPPEDSHASESERIARFWIPAWHDLLLYFVISSVLFIIMNAEALWQYFNRQVIGTEASISGDYSILTAPVFDFLNAHDTWVLLVVWGVIGCVVFGLIIGFQSIFKTAKQEVAESQYRVGGASANKDYWHSVVGLNLTFVGLAIGWMAYLYFYLNGLLTWVSQEFFAGLNGHWTDSYRIFIALLVDTFALYIFVKFTQIVIGSWHAIRPNE
jgi:hypothetical protein